MTSDKKTIKKIIKRSNYDLNDIISDKNIGVNINNDDMEPYVDDALLNVGFSVSEFCPPDYFINITSEMVPSIKCPKVVIYFNAEIFDSMNSLVGYFEFKGSMYRYACPQVIAETFVSLIPENLKRNNKKKNDDEKWIHHWQRGELGQSSVVYSPFKPIYNKVYKTNNIPYWGCHKLIDLQNLVKSDVLCDETTFFKLTVFSNKCILIEEDLDVFVTDDNFSFFNKSTKTKYPPLIKIELVNKDYYWNSTESEKYNTPLYTIRAKIDRNEKTIKSNKTNSYKQYKQENLFQDNLDLFSNTHTTSNNGYSGCFDKTKFKELLFYADKFENQEFNKFHDNINCLVVPGGLKVNVINKEKFGNRVLIEIKQQGIDSSIWTVIETINNK